MSVKDAALRSRELVRVPEVEWDHAWPSGRSRPSEVWLSKAFLAQIVVEDGGGTAHTRMTVCRTKINAIGRWQDGISWDDLMRVKRECGRGEVCALEVFPPDSQTVNVANMRHLWLMDDWPPFMWRPVDAQGRESRQSNEQGRE